MRLLLDSHALIWFLEGSHRLPAGIRKIIADFNNTCYISHASAWELAIKLGRGRLTLAFPYERLFPSIVNANNFIMLSSHFGHYRELLKLPHHHGDPFDRLIIAQAQVEELTIVTCDAQFADYDVPTLWA